MFTIERCLFPEVGLIVTGPLRVPHRLESVKVLLSFPNLHRVFPSLVGRLLALFAAWHGSRTPGTVPWSPARRPAHPRGPPQPGPAPPGPYASATSQLACRDAVDSPSPAGASPPVPHIHRGHGPLHGQRNDEQRQPPADNTCEAQHPTDSAQSRPPRRESHAGQRWCRLHGPSVYEQLTGGKHPVMVVFTVPGSTPCVGG